MFKTIILGICISLFICSCEGPAKITIKNKSSGAVVYRYEIISHDGIKTINTLQIPQSPDSNIVQFFFGFGDRWSDKGISSYIDTINSVEIITATDSMYIEKSEIFEFFREKRSGLVRKQLRIIID